jgi:hypothetical protein
MLEVFMNIEVCGFLLTALPQFTKTPHISPKMTFAVLLNLILATFFATLGQIFIFHTLIMIFFCSLLVIVLMHIATSKENPPFSFYFLPCAISWGIGAEILWLIDSIAPELKLDATAKYILYNGYFLGIIAGVGIRLIPGLLGHKDIVINQRSIYENNEKLPAEFWITIVSFNGFILSYLFWDQFIGNAIQVFWLLLVSMTYFRVHKIPRARTFQGFGVWFAVLFMLMGLVTVFFLPTAFVHWVHLIFVSGFLLLVTTVMTRVTIAHNDLGFEKENSKWLGFIYGLIIFAALTRASAYLIPHSYTNHLAYASILVIFAFGILFWFLKKFQK